MLALEVRVARLQRWTPSKARRQPYEDLLLIVADHILENEHHQKAHATSGGTPSAAPRARRTSRTIEYRLKPKD